jgi:hypothetical protein
MWKMDGDKIETEYHSLPVVSFLTAILRNDLIVPARGLPPVGDDVDALPLQW